jgi:hypothetical protein
MASFDKFIADLDRRQEEKRKRLEQLRQAQEELSVRDRVKLYAERWQNSVRYSSSKESK